MLSRTLAGLAVVAAFVGFAFAEDFRGSVTKVEDGTITVRSFGGFGKKGGEAPKSEEKVFKVAKDIKVTRVMGKDKDPVKLSLDELKTAIKVTTVQVTVTYDGENASEIKIGGGFGFGTGGKGGKGGKGKDKTEDK